MLKTSNLLTITAKKIFEYVESHKIKGFLSTPPTENAKKLVTTSNKLEQININQRQ